MNISFKIGPCSTGPHNWFVNMHVDYDDDDREPLIHRVATVGNRHLAIAALDAAMETAETLISEALRDSENTPKSAPDGGFMSHVEGSENAK